MQAKYLQRRRSSFRFLKCGSPYESNIIFVKNYTESSGSYKFLHKDYLGSILSISDEAGNKIEQRHYDAWGNLTHYQVNGGAIMTDENKIRDFMSNGGFLLDRGYTSHEHFAEVGLIHMNGSLYDPLLRRFLNADENIQDPYNTQNYNKYGYVMNNPLMFSDPSGESFLGNLFTSVFSLAANIFLGPVLGGFLSYIVGSIVNGSKINFGGALKAIFFSAVSAAASFGVGSIFTNAAGEATQLARNLKGAAFLVQAGAHGIAQGVLSLMQGGNFQSAFFSAVLGSVAAGSLGSISANKAVNAASQIVAGAIAGGVGSALSDGNFWQGAMIGGVVAAFNHAMHPTDGPFADDDGEDGPGPKKKIITPKKEPLKSKLRWLANTTEEVGGWMEIGGLVMAIPTEGVSLILTSVGGKFSFVGMTGNVLLDLYDDDYKMATFRILKYGVTLGAGKALDRVPGFKLMLQKPLWEANIQLWEKVISPIFEPKPKVQNIRK